MPAASEATKAPAAGAASTDCTRRRTRRRGEHHPSYPLASSGASHGSLSDGGWRIRPPFADAALAAAPE